MFGSALFVTEVRKWHQYFFKFICAVNSCYYQFLFLIVFFAMLRLIGEETVGDLYWQEDVSPNFWYWYTVSTEQTDWKTFQITKSSTTPSACNFSDYFKVDEKGTVTSASSAETEVAINNQGSLYNPKPVKISRTSKKVYFENRKSSRRKNQKCKNSFRLVYQTLLTSKLCKSFT